MDVDSFGKQDPVHFRDIFHFNLWSTPEFPLVSLPIFNGITMQTPSSPHISCFFIAV
jgi:hypothetical protein